MLSHSRKALRPTIKQKSNLHIDTIAARLFHIGGCSHYSQVYPYMLMLKICYSIDFSGYKEIFQEWVRLMSQEMDTIAIFITNINLILKYTYVSNYTAEFNSIIYTWIIFSREKDSWFCFCNKSLNISSATDPPVEILENLILTYLQQFIPPSYSISKYYHQPDISWFATKDEQFPAFNFKDELYLGFRPIFKSNLFPNLLDKSKDLIKRTANSLRSDTERFYNLLCMESNDDFECEELPYNSTVNLFAGPYKPYSNSPAAILQCNGANYRVELACKRAAGHYDVTY